MSGTTGRERSMPSAASPLHGRYLATDWKLRALLAGSDVLLVPLRGRNAGAIPPLRRVLLAINGHLGDAVIATATIATLAEAWPDLEIGVLLPSWSREVIEGHPRISHVHTVDHWHTSRARTGAAGKWLAYRRSRRRALAEIRRVVYDAAVDLYDYFPNAALLLRRAGIPVRIGFDAAGFSSLYSHAVAWPDDERHTAERQLLLLRTLVPSIEAGAVPRPSLPDADAATRKRVEGILAAHGLLSGTFTVVHIGAGSPDKALRVDEWRAIAEHLVAVGDTLVFTGRGATESRDVGLVSRGLERCLDLCDSLAWPEFVELVRRARALVSLDTVAGHVAAAVGTPSVTLWTSMSNPHHWHPLSDVNVVVDGRRHDALDEALAHLTPPPSSVR